MPETHSTSERTPSQEVVTQSADLFSNTKALGSVLRTSGTIVDAQFSDQKVPQIHNKLVIQVPAPSSGSGDAQEVVYVSVEVAQHLGDGVVRCIALEALGKISSGVPVADTGTPIKVPLAHKFLDACLMCLAAQSMAVQKLKRLQRWSVHRSAPH